MKKSLTIGQFVRRCLLIVLGTFVLILVLVFFLDRYKAQSFSNVDNIYDDDYFAKENLADNGFVFYSDYMNSIYEYYSKNDDAALKEKYQTNVKALLTNSVYKYLTFKKANFSSDNKDKTFEMIRNIMSKARYKEELEYFLSDYSTKNINTLANEMNGMTTFTSWVTEDLELPEVIEDTIEFYSNEGVSYWKINGVETTIEATKEELSKGRPVGSVNADGYIVINDSVVTDIKSKSTTDATYLNADKFFNVDYATVLDFVKTFNDEATIDTIKNAISSSDFKDLNLTTDNDKVIFVYLLNQDFIKNRDESIYCVASGFSVEEYDNLNFVVNELKTIVNTEADTIKSSLAKWKDYYQNVLLGYEGDCNPVQTIKYNLNDGSGNYYEVSLNSSTAAFKFYLKDKSGTIISEWASNPDVIDDTVNQQIFQHSQFTLYYSTSRGRTASYTTYEHSVSDHVINSTDALTPNFAVKYDQENNKIIVWYELEKREIDYTYFPEKISYEHMEELVARNEQMVADGVSGVVSLKETMDKGSSYYTKLTHNFYNLIKSDNIANEYGIDYYEHQGSYTNMSKLEREKLYKYFYQLCDYCAVDENGEYKYTYEYEGQEGLNDLAYDNAVFASEVNIDKPKFTFAVEYSLTEDGLSVLIPGNSITENSSYPICYIDILPYFTATPSGVEGYTVIPDGSGEVLIHDNGNTAYPKYDKRVYTTDLTDTQYVNDGSTSDLLLPIYGVVNTSDETWKYKKNGILTYISSNAASFGFTADTTRGDNYYNMNYYTLYVREDKDIVFGQAAYERTEFTKWTNVRNSEDTQINYSILAGDELNYADIAKRYKEILIKKYDLVELDNTTSPTLDLDVIGMYTYKDNFAGIQYKAKDTLTTFDQLETMINDLLGTGVNDINVAFLGWRNTALVNKSFRKISVSKLCGAKAKFQALLSEYNADNNVTVYPYVDFIEYESFYESFGKYHYVAHAVDGSLSYRQPYDLSSNIFDKTKAKIYALSPRYYLTFAEQLAKNYTKASKGASTLAIRSLGSTLVGDYKRNIETFKSNAVEAQIEALDVLTNNGIDKLTLYTPYDYAFKYVSVAKEIPYQGTQYEILDYSIPFYQLIVNGLFDYSGESINANSGKGINEHIMRIIETGSNISFTFSYDSSEKLLQTDYNNYYYTLYTDWVNDVQNVYTELNNLGIYSMRLTNHERVSSNIYKVTYSGNGKTTSIYLNYTRNAYTALDGTQVPAKSYAVAK